MRLEHVNISGRTDNLLRVANDVTKTGYLKRWKANGMIMQLVSLPEMGGDWERFLSYVKSCLKMEGFTDADCEVIATFMLLEHVDALRTGEIRERE